MVSNIDQMQPEVIKPNENDEFSTPERCRILELWNTDKDPSVSIARARVKPGITTQLHRIKGIVERYLIISGSGKVQIGDKAPETVTTGDVVIIPEDTPQKITNTGNQFLEFYCICTPRFTPEKYENLERK